MKQRKRRNVISTESNRFGGAGFVWGLFHATSWICNYVKIRKLFVERKKIKKPFIAGELPKHVTYYRYLRLY